MKKFLITLFFAIGFASPAFADCWMQCIKNPIGSGCMGKVKMCNVTDSDKALESLGRDLGAAYDNIKNEWTNIYGRLPEELRYITDTYPITFAMLLIPGTREYALLTMALEKYVLKAKQRGADMKEFIDTAPDWKRKQAVDGYTFVYVNEGLDLGNTDWSNPALAPIPDRYDAAWANFVNCLTAAVDFNQGNVCLKTLKVEVVNASL